MDRYRCLFYYLLLIFLSYTVHSQSLNNSTANVSTSWPNNHSAILPTYFSTGEEIRIIVNLAFDPADEDFQHVALGYYRGDDRGSFLLAVVLYHDGLLYSTDSGLVVQVLWSANRNTPIRENGTLEFTEDGDLILSDVDDTLVWSTNTSGRSIVGLQVTKMGNLVLYDQNNSIIWQSFDHPTDTLVLGQKLVEGQKLVASSSPTSWSEGLYSLSVTDQGLYAFIDFNPPTAYYQSLTFGNKNGTQPSFCRFDYGSFDCFILNPGSGRKDYWLEVPKSDSIQFVKLGSDGHFRAYALKSLYWLEVSDLLSAWITECEYPEVCGTYGVCSDGQCSCPEPNYFRPINERKLELGCSRITPQSRETSQYHHLIDLKDVTFFNPDFDGLHTNLASCKEACLTNCSCIFAFFRRQDNDTNGLCFLQSNAISLVDTVPLNNPGTYSAHVKVQGTSPSAPPPAPPSAVDNNSKILRTVFGISIGVFLVAILISWSRKLKILGRGMDDSLLDRLSLVPTRFCYRELKEATGNFSTKLGQGGFGSVYKGVLVDDTEIAVKRLDGLGQIKESFLAEVGTIGQIHHVNLVRLIGFCAHKSRMLLVYEYMRNGSLDKWIFHKEQGECLDWKTRQKIISDLAKGLAYLHEGCQQRILHLDIKPQNILLDEKFNAKISDFGLSKLIGKDQSKVVAALRGTPGYLAPEWFGFVISDKVDVYSFGIVVLEIFCGRKIFDSSKPGEYMHLLSLLERKEEEGQLHDMIDCHDMEPHKEEVVKMMKLTAWCIQSDLSRRPSMSLVVKVLDGLTDVESILDYKFTTTPLSNGYLYHINDKLAAKTLLLASILSGPR